MRTVPNHQFVKLHWGPWKKVIYGILYGEQYDIWTEVMPMSMFFCAFDDFNVTGRRDFPTSFPSVLPRVPPEETMKSGTFPRNRWLIHDIFQLGIYCPFAVFFENVWAANWNKTQPSPRFRPIQTYFSNPLNSRQFMCLVFHFLYYTIKIFKNDLCSYIGHSNAPTLWWYAWTLVNPPPPQPLQSSPQRTQRCTSVCDPRSLHSTNMYRTFGYFRFDGIDAHLLEIDPRVNVGSWWNSSPRFSNKGFFLGWYSHHRIIKFEPQICRGKKFYWLRNIQRFFCGFFMGLRFTGKCVSNVRKSCLCRRYWFYECINIIWDWQSLQWERGRG